MVSNRYDNPLPALSPLSGNQVHETEIDTTELYAMAKDVALCNG